MQKIKQLGKEFNWWKESILYNHAILFFSTNKWLGVFLLVASFIHPVMGLCGVLGLFTANVFGRFIGLNSETLRKGFHGFDAMLVSFGLAATYEVNATLIAFILCIGIVSVLIGIFIQGILHKYQLPSLSIPFIVTAWILLSAATGMKTLVVRHELLYSLNAVHPHSTNWLAKWLDVVHSFSVHYLGWLPVFWKIYFKSLGALYFLPNLITGILMAIGILIYSRIAFTLSVIGFWFGYICYPFFGGNVSEMTSNFIGLSFIFTAIGIGGIYLVPSIKSYLVSMLMMPLIILLFFGFSKLLAPFGVPVYSIPFSLIVILFLYLLHYRIHVSSLPKVIHQLHQPEKNLYAHLNVNHRMSRFTYFPIHLPFWGEWMVSQAHEGKITHLGEWSKAFDFIVLDEEMKSHRSLGATVDDFYCYNKPVVACADGYIVAVQDHVEDNETGGVNTLQNWGNSIVMYHTDGLYSQVSHLKKESIKYTIGDYVKKGEILAYCGNSGRSPEPHIHFQLQSTPEIGAKTLDFPLAYYLVKTNQSWELKTFAIPKEGELICGIETNTLLKNAFDFIPGKKLKWRIEQVGKTDQFQHWEVFTDSLNHSYIYCYDTHATAYFYNDGNMFVFTDFLGDQTSLLYHFYLANYKLILGYYQGLSIEEKYPVATLKMKLFDLFQDVFAPFYRFVQSNYRIEYVHVDDVHLTTKIQLNATAELSIASWYKAITNYETLMTTNELFRFNVKSEKLNFSAVCEL